MSYREYFDWDSKIENIDTYTIDSVSSINSVCHAIIYKVHYLLLFYCRDNLMQLYTIFDEITKINDYNSLDIFVGCDIVYIDLLKFSREYEFLVVQCINITEYIDTVFTLRFYTLEISDEFQIIPHHITDFEMNRLVKDVKVVSSSLTKDDLYVIVLANEGMRNDSIIYFVGMNCTQSINKREGATDLNLASNKFLSTFNDKLSTLSCVLSNYDIYAGLNLDLDQFIVNSFMFIDREPLFVVSVDNFGLLVIDIVSKTIVDKLCFTSMINNFPNTFSIVKIIQIGETGMRILLEDNNGFSLFWKRIAKIGDQEHVFVDLSVSEYHVGINEGMRTNLIDGTKNGYSRLILTSIKDSNIQQASVRVFLNNYHEKSKIYTEIGFGKVSTCVFISQKFSLNRIVLVCDSLIYLVKMNLAPMLTLGIDNNQIEYDCIVYSSNGLSDQEIQIHVKSELQASFQTKLLSGVIFVCSVIVFVLSAECIYQKIMETKYLQNIKRSHSRASIVMGPNEKDGNKINSKFSIFKKEESIRSTPRFENPNEENYANNCQLYVTKENLAHEEHCNSLKTNSIFSMIRKKNMLNNDDKSENKSNTESIRLSSKIMGNSIESCSSDD